MMYIVRLGVSVLFSGRIFLLSLLLLTCLQGKAQSVSNEGRDFWLCFPFHTPYVKNGITHSAEISVFITSKSNSSGKVFYGNSSKPFTVTANTVTEIILPREETFLDNKSQMHPGKGIRVLVDEGMPKVVVYGHVFAGSRSAATLVLPVEALGQEYYAMAYDQGPNAGTSQFQVVSVDGEVHLKIKPAGQPSFSVTLEKTGDVYQYQNTTDVSGTIIEVDANLSPCKRIAVFSGSSATYIQNDGCSERSVDPLIQQLYPVESWGKTYALVPFYNRLEGSIYRVMAAEDNTQVSFLNNTHTLNKGEFITSKPTYQTGVLKSDKPVSVAQYALTQACGKGEVGDPDMVLLNPLEYSIKTVTMYSAIKENIKEQYLNVVIPTAKASTFLLNDQPYTGTFKPVEGAPDLSYTQFELTGKGSDFNLSADAGFNALAYGFGSHESYAYSAGTSLASTKVIEVIPAGEKEEVAEACAGNTYHFKLTLPYQAEKLIYQLEKGGEEHEILNPESEETQSGSEILYSYTLDVNKVYTKAGSEQIKIRVVPKTSLNSCFNVAEDVITYDLEVAGVPKASFSHQKPACQSAPVAFTFLPSSGRPVNSWFWDFGDGHQSTEMNPSHTYEKSGTYSVTLVVENAAGCVSEVSEQQVVISPSPVADFEFSVPSCATKAIEFSDKSEVEMDKITSWEWDFGDGSAPSTQSDPEHVYAQAGDYEVTLTVKTPTGCSDVVKKTITISPLRAIDFNFQALCVKDAVQFEVIDPSADIIKWEWDFGDGNTSTEMNPSHTYEKSETYFVKLKATNTMGCVYEVSKKEVTVFPLPEAQFSFTSPSCETKAIQFSDKSEVEMDKITSWEWNFGDGHQSTEMNPSHTYEKSGTYSVMLVVANTAGCVSEVLKKEVRVFPLPEAKFSFSTPSCETRPIQFSDQSKVETGEIVAWEWDFGDGSLSTQQDPTHAFTQAGEYEVTLTVKTTEGCSDVYTEKITIHPLSAIDFEFHTSCEKNVVQFNLKDPLSQIVSWYWDFGDGTTSTEMNPSHTYKKSGVYTVKFVATGAVGCVAQTPPKEVRVFPLPEAKFSFSSPSCETRPIQFSDQSTVETGEIVAWEWDFGDGSAPGREKDPKHTFTQAGEYEVTLTVSTSQGCSDVYTEKITIHPLSAIDFEFQTSCEKNAVQFNLKDPLSQTVSWYWDFGDGTTSTEMNPSHTYRESGIYTVKFVAIGAVGCVAQTPPKNVTVFPLPEAKFSFISASCATKAIQFSDQSKVKTGEIVAWEWDFGDGSAPGREKDPEHVYAQAGEYEVTLTVSSSQGCSDVYTEKITIHPLPAVDFSFQNSCEKNAVQFKIEGPSAKIVKWEWDFGDGNRSTEMNPVHVYEKSGKYRVELKVEDAGGCMSEMPAQEVTVFPLPEAKFSFSGPSCVTNAIQFSDQSKVETGDIVALEWDFGDGSTPNTQIDPEHVYEQAGEYEVTLTVSSSQGCRDVYTETITIHPLPAVDFSFPASCINDIVQFEATDPSAEEVKWEWNFGDGSPFTSENQKQNPQHQFYAPGNYDVSLRVTSAEGCKSEIIHTIKINSDNIVPGFEVLNAGQLCSSREVSFRNTSTIDEGEITRIEFLLSEEGNSLSPLIDEDPTPGEVYNYNFPLSYEARSYTVVLRAYSGQACFQETDPVTIDINPIPVLYFDAVGPLCESEGSIALQAGEINNIYGNGMFEGAGIEAQHFNPGQAGVGKHTITFSFTTSGGCTEVISQTIEVTPTPAIDAGPDLDILIGGKRKLEAKKIAGELLQYFWLPEEGLSDPHVLQPLASPLISTTYRLLALTPGGCSAVDEVKVTVHDDLKAPSAFSPNGDGVNDTWSIQHLESWVGADIRIYNRYGQQVFYAKQYTSPWDGTANKKEMPAGIYYYVIEPNNGKPRHTGSLTLVR